MNQEILSNRKKYLEILRSGKYTKGTIKSDDRGNPIIESKEDDEGHCACAIMLHEFGKESKGRFLMSRSMKSLGLKPKDCRYIQEKINDTSANLNTIADRIEKEVFKQPSK